jgi:uncharacterized protein (DUF924 family)
MGRSKDILSFWFGENLKNPLNYSNQWWKKDPDFDREIRDKFEKDVQLATSGSLDSWRQQPETCLAFIILLDQFSRNIYRDTPQAFSQDPLALEAALQAIEHGLDKEIPTIARTFFYLPLMHAEDREMQRRCVGIFAKLLQEAPAEFTGILKGGYDHAKRHAEIIERFGRFPHRNQILERPSTPEEIEFLKQPGSSF